VAAYAHDMPLRIMRYYVTCISSSTPGIGLTLLLKFMLSLKHVIKVKTQSVTAK